MESFGVVKHWLSYHSEDRDLVKNPNPSSFDIDLPIDYKNVVTLRLVDIHLPIPFLFSGHSFSFNATTVTIPDGNYDDLELALCLRNLLGVTVAFDETKRVLILTNSSPFTLNFEGHPQTAIYLGFAQTSYTGTSIQAPNPPFRHLAAYLELNLYNNVDEMLPYPERSNYLIGARSGGSHYASFCKIPLSGKLETSHTSLSNIFYADPPLERLLKLKCKLRYHDGTLLDIRGAFTLTLEITSLRNEFIKDYILNKTGFRLS